MDLSSTTSYARVSEEILSSLDLQRLARKHRTKSDFNVPYCVDKTNVRTSPNESTCGSEAAGLVSDDEFVDESPLYEDGLSDGEFDETAKHVRHERRRFCTFDGCETPDDYEAEDCPSPRRIVPMMSEQRPNMIPILSGQGSFGLVTATPSNPIMIICCGPAPQGMTLGVPIHNCANITPQTPLAEEPATPATVAAPPTSPPGTFIPNACISPSCPATPATACSMRPPGSWGTGCSATSRPARPEASKKDDSKQVKKCTKPKKDECTTVMLRNLPSFFTRGMLVELIDSLGFGNKYDFVHLPVDLARLSCLGFGFVNFRTHKDALCFLEDANGFHGWPRHSNKVLNVSWSNPLQGLAAQIQRYRNSSIMHPSVPEQCRPLLFGESGERRPFPHPTIAIRAPHSS